MRVALTIVLVHLLIPAIVRAQEGTDVIREVVARDTTLARVTFIVEPPGALIMVDTLLLPKARLTVDMPAGQHRVIVRHRDEGYTTSDRFHYFMAGGDETVRVTLRRLIASLDLRGMRPSDDLTVEGWVSGLRRDTVLYVLPDTVRLAFTNGVTGNRLHATLPLYPEDRLLVELRPDRFSPHRFIPSIIIPGLTQFNDGAYLKAGGCLLRL